jgi:dolichol-phosphate mannosyltransferase
MASENGSLQTNFSLLLPSILASRSGKLFMIRPTQSPPWDRSPGKVFIVLPAYNEEGNLGLLLQRIDQVLYQAEMEYQVIVVDDGSEDQTLVIAQEYTQYMPIHIERHMTNKGLGATIRDGLRIAAERCGERDIVVAMDADNTHTPGLLRSIIRTIEEGSDVVIASRYQAGSVVRGVPAHRRFLSLGASWLLRFLFPMPGIKDYTCGYRAYRGRLLQDAFARFGSDFINQEGFQCMVDILIKLRELGAVCTEVPLILRYDLKSGGSKMNVWRTVRKTLSLVLTRRFAWWLRKPQWLGNPGGMQNGSE